MFHLNKEIRTFVQIKFSAITMKKVEVLLVASFVAVQVLALYTYWYLLLPLLILYACYTYTRKLFRDTLEINGKAILITGCDTGFGNHLAKYLDKLGFIVFAGVLSDKSKGAEELRRMSNRLHVLKLDVTKNEDVKAVLRYITENGGTLWGVVNNAGINFPGDLELATVDQYQRCADVNLYGMIRVIKASLPFIRKSKGRIVNISSVKGRYSWPCDSVYIVTKHGIETLSDSLRMEMVKFGVHVSIVEPGQFDGATSILGQEQLIRLKREMDHMWSMASDEVRATYGRQYFDHPYNQAVYYNKEQRPMSDNLIMEAILDALINVEPSSRYLIGGTHFAVDKLAVMARIYSFLPDWASDAIVGYMTRCTEFPTFDK